MHNKVINKKCGNKKCKCKNPTFRKNNANPDGRDYECEECRRYRSRVYEKRKKEEMIYMNEIIGNYFSRR